jgi:hypothetical protein
VTWESLLGGVNQQVSSRVAGGPRRRVAGHVHTALLSREGGTEGDFVCAVVVGGVVFLSMLYYAWSLEEIVFQPSRSAELELTRVWQHGIIAELDKSHVLTTVQF